MRTGQLVIRWLERADRFLLDASTVDAYGESIARLLAALPLVADPARLRVSGGAGATAEPAG
jgi:hypothetical protein